MDDASVRFISRGQNPARTTDAPCCSSANACGMLRTAPRSSCTRVRSTSNGCVTSVAMNPAKVLQPNVRAALWRPSPSAAQERLKESYRTRNSPAYLRVGEIRENGLQQRVHVRCITRQSGRPPAHEAARALDGMHRAQRLRSQGASNTRGGCCGVSEGVMRA